MHMKKGIIIGIIIIVIIIIVIIGIISAYSIIDHNSNTVDETISPDIIQTPTGTNHSIELTEGITMTAPSP